MAQRPFWQGYLKLSLVTCAVAMIPARSDAEKVKFHTLNRKTGNRVEARSIDAVTGKPVPEEDEVKGYEKGDDDFVMLEDDELQAVALESTRTIDVETFVPKETIEWIWYDRPHFLVPSDKVGAEAFCVIRDAMKATGTVGISRVVLYRRERAMMLEPRDAGIVAWTLRYGDEVRDPKEYFEDVGSPRVDGELMTLVKKLIGERSKPWSADMTGDPVQERLKEIIAAKNRGKRPAKSKADPPRADNVIDIMEALRKSVAAQSKRPRGK